MGFMELLPYLTTGIGAVGSLFGSLSPERMKYKINPEVYKQISQLRGIASEGFSDAEMAKMRENFKNILGQEAEGVSSKAQLRLARAGLAGSPAEAATMKDIDRQKFMAIGRGMADVEGMETDYRMNALKLLTGLIGGLPTDYERYGEKSTGQGFSSLFGTGLMGLMNMNQPQGFTPTDEMRISEWKKNLSNWGQFKF